MVDVPFGQSAKIVFGFVTDAGAPAKVDGLPVVSTTLGTVSEVTSEGDKFVVFVTPGAVGAASVSVSADADVGEGVEPIGFALAELNALPSPKASAIVIDSVTVG